MRGNFYDQQKSSLISSSSSPILRSCSFLREAILLAPFAETAAKHSSCFLSEFFVKICTRQYCLDVFCDPPSEITSPSSYVIKDPESPPGLLMKAPIWLRLDCRISCSRYRGSFRLSTNVVGPSGFSLVEPPTPL